MERFRLVVEQIEEAKRLLLNGSVLTLRLAMILLDNAAEILISRELNYQFAWDDQLKNLRPPKNYTPDERTKAQRYFDDKVTLLVRFGKLSNDQAAVMKACHQFRGEMFHAEHIRRQILNPAAILLFHTVVDCFLQLPTRSYLLPHEAEDDNRRFSERFGIADKILTVETTMRAISAVLKDGVALDTDALPSALSTDLAERIDQTIQHLFDVNEDKNEREVDRNLRYHQFWMAEGITLMEARVGRIALDKAFDEWNARGQAKFTLPRLKKWRKTAELIARCPPPMALRHYCGLDRIFRPFEDDVALAVIEHEERIDAQIEERRLRKKS